MENIKGNPYRGQSAHCADEWHVGSRLAGGRTCAGNLDAAAEIQGVWFRGVGSSSHICSFCHASRPKTSEPKASICTGQVLSRKSETFSQASEHHLTRLNTSSSDFVALVYRISRGKGGGDLPARERICQSQPPIFVSVFTIQGIMAALRSLRI